MKKLIKLLKSLFTVGKPKEYEDTIRARLTPRVNTDTKQIYTYAEVTALIPANTIIQFGATEYRFDPSPSGKQYTDRKTNSQKAQPTDQFSLVHTIAQDWEGLDVAT